MKKILVDSEEEFERLLKDICWEVSEAHDPWRLLKGLDAEVPKYVKEINQTVAFWQVTFASLHANVLSRLGRLYDKTGGSLSLGNFLFTVKANTGHFSESAFLRRLQGNARAKTLFEKMNRAEIESEIRSVSGDDSLVKRLHHIRDKRIAHRDGDMVRLDSLSSMAGLSVAEIDTLLDRARRITGKYSRLWNASVLATRIAGGDDYERLLKLIRRGLITK